MRKRQRGRGRRAAIAQPISPAATAAAGHGADVAARREHANAPVSGIDHEDPAGTVDRHRRRAVERRAGRSTAIAGEAAADIGDAGNGRDVAADREPADHVEGLIGDEDIAVAVPRNRDRPIELGRGRRPAIAGKSRRQRARHGRDRLRRSIPGRDARHGCRRGNRDRPAPHPLLQHPRPSARSNSPCEPCYVRGARRPTDAAGAAAICPSIRSCRRPETKCYPDLTLTKFARNRPPIGSG